MSMTQGLSLVSDMKLGHYLKVPPKAMFMAQLIPTIVGTFVSTAVASFMYESFEVPVSSSYPAGFVWLLQELPAASGWSSNNYKVFMNTLFGFVIGLILPVIFVFPLQPGGQRSDLITPLLVALVVNYYVKKYKNTWWKKHAYVMSAAFDVGSGLMVLLLFFATQFNSEYHTPFPAWFMNSGDAERCIPDANIICNDNGKSLRLQVSSRTRPDLQCLSVFQSYE
ncbi:hypothetical protein CcCBS67573_g07973 [Chytriomyces confervae]|uniref:Oligopeptide transporter n=1 Tax=Chytriomyces confervae TaxID=246404 RepID=A0A507ES24_9FUNG|nr:hypothetical protein CcCBS67573_g07973 [Chytriomyces confervae]